MSRFKLRKTTLQAKLEKTWFESRCGLAFFQVGVQSVAFRSLKQDVWSNNLCNFLTLRESDSFNPIFILL